MEGITKSGFLIVSHQKHLQSDFEGILALVWRPVWTPVRFWKRFWKEVLWSMQFQIGRGSSMHSVLVRMHSVLVRMHSVLVCMHSVLGTMHSVLRFFRADFCWSECLALYFQHDSEIFDFGIPYHQKYGFFVSERDPNRPKIDP